MDFKVEYKFFVFIIIVHTDEQKILKDNDLYFLRKITHILTILKKEFVFFHVFITVRYICGYFLHIKWADDLVEVEKIVEKRIQ